jgi:hypothetical protein
MTPRTAVATLLTAAALPAAAREYCAIPMLFPGVPVEVEVEEIDKGICGVALIRNRYVRIESDAVRKISGPIVCNANDFCTRRTDYFLSDPDTVPYIVVFKGPRAGGRG